MFHILAGISDPMATSLSIKISCCFNSTNTTQKRPYNPGSLHSDFLIFFTY